MFEKPFSQPWGTAQPTYDGMTIQTASSKVTTVSGQGTLVYDVTTNWTFTSLGGSPNVENGTVTVLQWRYHHQFPKKAPIERGFHFHAVGTKLERASIRLSLTYRVVMYVKLILVYLFFFAMLGTAQAQRFVMEDAGNYTAKFSVSPK
ncbi:MAG TPA: hypothetical protein VF598_01365, partial [Hymenobacter sp.]